MGRKELEAMIEAMLDKIPGGLLFDPGDGVGFIDPQGRGWNIVVRLTSNPSETVDPPDSGGAE